MCIGIRPALLSPQQRKHTQTNIRSNRCPFSTLILELCLAIIQFIFNRWCVQSKMDKHKVVVLLQIFLCAKWLTVVLCEQKEIFTIDRSDGVTYDPTWDSLDARPLPLWYDRAKVGIFVHWGVYSVPSFGSEWFWTNWRNEKVESYVNYMSDNFKPGFTYQEFAHDFTAEHFNASEWAQLFEESGAKLVYF